MIDSSEKAAEAYKKNFPDAKVYNQECNSFLKKVMEGSMEGFPKKVEMLVLQAGHYGVAQPQSHLILLPVAACLTLASFPKPLHTFARPHYLEMVVDGRKYSPTCKWLSVAR